MEVVGENAGQERQIRILDNQGNPSESPDIENTLENVAVKRGRGRPRKDQTKVAVVVNRQRGRPKKARLPEKRITRSQTKQTLQINLRERPKRVEEPQAKRGRPTKTLITTDFRKRAPTEVVDVVPAKKTKCVHVKRKRGRPRKGLTVAPQRKRGRPRKHVQPLEIKRKRGRPRKLTTETLKRKRGRPRKILESNPTDPVEDEFINELLQIKRSNTRTNLARIRRKREKKDGQVVRRKRGRPRKAPVPSNADFENGKSKRTSGKQSEKLVPILSEELDLVPMIRDPLSRVDIYYRNLLFIWDRDLLSFRCSLCRFHFPFDCDSSLNKRFHRHFTKCHTDRYRCQHCPGLARFRNDFDLQYHIRYWHPYQSDDPPLQEPSPQHVDGQQANSVKYAPESFSTTNHAHTDKENGKIIEVQNPLVEVNQSCRRSPLSINDCQQKVPLKLKNLTCNNLPENFQPSKPEKKCKIKPIPCSKYQCRICSEGFHNRRSLQKHCLTHPVTQVNLPFNCMYPRCPAKSSSSEAVQHHIGRKHDTDELICKICGKLCGSMDQLNIHSKIHESLNDLSSTHKCPHCPKSFHLVAAFKDHLLEVHKEGKPISCPFEDCKGELFYSRYRLKRHFKVCHKQIVVVNYPEDIAQPGFTPKKESGT